MDNEGIFLAKNDFNLSPEAIPQLSIVHFDFFPFSADTFMQPLYVRFPAFQFLPQPVIFPAQLPAIF